MKSIAVCLTSYNRREVTLHCLRKLAGVALPASHDLKIYLTDDASADGTAEAVFEEFPDVIVLQGSGHLYWGGGMTLSLAAAMAVGYDYYLWLNDDVELYSDGLKRVIGTYNSVSNNGENPVLIIGAVCESATQKTTYSGVTCTSISPIKFIITQPNPNVPVECDTMNGNVVLVPAEVVRKVGNLDPKFTHAIGDFDYGLRARRSGFGIWIAPGFVGSCSKKIRPASWASAGLSFKERIRVLKSPLGPPFGQFMMFAYRHGGLRGIVFALFGYRRLIIPK
jgi:GT2 family glycosyltransferase